jgi:hypothetical protein
MGRHDELGSPAVCRPGKPNHLTSDRGRSLPVVEGAGPRHRMGRAMPAAVWRRAWCSGMTSQRFLPRSDKVRGDALCPAAAGQLALDMAQRLTPASTA